MVAAGGPRYEFEIGDLHFNRVEMFASKERITKYTFLLSATLFHGMKYDIDDTENQKFIVNVPDGLSLNRDFEIVNLKGQMYAQIDGILIQDTEDQFFDIDNFSQIDEIIKRNKWRR